MVLCVKKHQVAFCTLHLTKMHHNLIFTKVARYNLEILFVIRYLCILALIIFNQGPF